MDLVLRICDDLFLDAAWAKIVPLDAFPVQLANGSTIVPVMSQDSSAWTQLVSHLPRPLVDIPEDLYAPFTKSVVSAWPRDYVPRQLLSLCLITMIGIHLLYFIFAGFSYYFIFNHDMMNHPRFLPNQVRQEILCSIKSFPGMLALTLPWFQAEVMGYSKLYDGLDTHGWWYLIVSVPL